MNLQKSASAEEIRKAYLSLSKKLHPDKGGTEADFKFLGEAYAVLTDSQKRRNYDKSGDPDNPFGPPPSRPWAPPQSHKPQPPPSQGCRDEQALDLGRSCVCQAGDCIGSGCTSLTTYPKSCWTCFCKKRVPPPSHPTCTRAGALSLPVSGTAMTLCKCNPGTHCVDLAGSQCHVHDIQMFPFTCSTCYCARQHSTTTTTTTPACPADAERIGENLCECTRYTGFDGPWVHRVCMVTGILEINNKSRTVSKRRGCGMSKLKQFSTPCKNCICEEDVRLSDDWLCCKNRNGDYGWVKKQKKLLGLLHRCPDGLVGVKDSSFCDNLN